jgi:hypothetical protein
MRISLVVILLVSTLAVNAGYKVCSKVFDSKDNPLAEVIVTIFGLKTQAKVTDKNGFVEFDVRKGYYYITLSHVGFRDTTVQCRIVSDSCFLLVMNYSSSALKGVTVRSKKPLSKVMTYLPNEIRVSSKDIRQFPKIAGETDPIRYLQLLPGISFAHEGSADLNIRGGAKDQTMISVNKMPVFAQEHLLGLYSTFNDKSISSLGLYTGNIDGSYGSFGISVVDLDYLSDSINKSAHCVKLGMLGSRLGSKGSIVKDKWFYNVNARTSYTFFESQLPADFWDMSIASAYHIDTRNKIELITQSSNDNIAIAEIYDVAIAFNKTNNFIQLGWENNNREKDRVISNYIGFSQYSKLGYASTFDESYEDESLLALNVNGQEWYTHHFSVDQSLSHGLALGYGVQSSLAKNIERDHQYEETLNYSIPFVLSNFEKVTLGEAFNIVPYIDIVYDTANWIFHGALRANIFKNLTSGKGYLPLEGTLGVSKKQKLNTFSLSVDRRTQINHNVNPFYIANDLERWSFANDHLKPQIVNQVALSFLQKRSHLTWSNAIYAKNINNIYIYRDGANIYLADFSEEVLPAHGYAYGIETGLVYTTPLQTISLNYTYGRSFVRNEQVNRGEFFPADFDRPHSLKYFHTLRIRKHTTFSINGILASGRPLTVIEYADGPFFIFSDRNAYRLPFYKRIDVSFNHNRAFFKGKLLTELSYGAYNVVNFRNPFFVVYSGSGTDENGNYVTTYDFINLMPILPYVSLEISF